jgi:hypothetical protein
MADKSKNWWEKLLYGTGETHTIPQVTVPVTDEERRKSIEGGYMNPSITALDNAPKGTNLRALETANGNLVTRPADYTGIQGSATQAGWHNVLRDLETANGNLVTRPADYTGIQGTPGKTTALSSENGTAVQTANNAPYVSYTGANQVSNPSQVAGVPQDVYNEITKPFEQSAAFKEITAYNEQLLKQLTAGRTAYSDELDNLIAQYKDRGDFAYDPNSDMLYQNYLTAMQNAGQMAMKDTMGQAAALTGGYGSTYATAAANGAYNNYLQTANDNLVNFYDMALDKYNLESEQALRGIDLTRLQDESEYNRLLNAYEANANAANNMYNREYNEWAGSVGQWQNIADAMRGDYWNDKSNQLSVDLNNADLAYKYDALNQSKNEFEREMAYRENAAAQEQENWERQLELSGVETIPAGETFDNMTEAQRNSVYQNALSAYKDGGQEGINAFMESLVGYNLSPEEEKNILDYVDKFARKEYTMTNDVLGVKKNEYTDQWGRTYTYKELEEMHKKGEIDDETWKGIKKLSKEGQSYITK